MEDRKGLGLQDYNTYLSSLDCGIQYYYQFYDEIHTISFIIQFPWSIAYIQQSDHFKFYFSVHGFGYVAVSGYKGVVRQYITHELIEREFQRQNNDLVNVIIFIRNNLSADMRYSRKCLGKRFHVNPRLITSVYSIYDICEHRRIGLHFALGF